MPQAERTACSYRTSVGARYCRPLARKISVHTSSVLASTFETNCPISSVGAPRGASRVSLFVSTCWTVFNTWPGSNPRNAAMIAITTPPMPTPPATPIPRRSSTLPLALSSPSCIGPPSVDCEVKTGGDRPSCIPRFLQRGLFHALEAPLPGAGLAIDRALDASHERLAIAPVVDAPREFPPGILEDDA